VKRGARAGPALKGRPKNQAVEAPLQGFRGKVSSPVRPLPRAGGPALRDQIGLPPFGLRGARKVSRAGLKAEAQCPALAIGIVGVRVEDSLGHQYSLEQEGASQGNNDVQAEGRIVLAMKTENRPRTRASPCQKAFGSSSLRWVVWSLRRVPWLIRTGLINKRGIRRVLRRVLWRVLRLDSGRRRPRPTGADPTLTEPETLSRLSGLATYAGLGLLLLWLRYSSECRKLVAHPQELPFLVLRFLVPHADGTLVAATGHAADQRAQRLIVGRQEG
jgi:hypothetical protein